MLKPRSSVVLISCGKNKIATPAPAKQLYTSTRFQEARKFAEYYGSKWFIISAEHGLVDPDHILAPYDRSLEAMAESEKEEWSNRVLCALADNTSPDEQIIVLAGGSYCESLYKNPNGKTRKFIFPFRQISPDIEETLLKRINSNPDRITHYNKFYELLLRLQKLPNQMIPFHEMKGNQLSKAGVYFFFDKAEFSRFYESETLRVVRIGTHGVSKGSKSKLWQRLRTHRGNDDGSGSHRSSIFRLHVGNCILALKGEISDSWGVGENAPPEIRALEISLENSVSEYLRELLVAHLPIEDPASSDSDRSYIEKNAISLLTEGGPIDIQTTQWLGNASPVKQIRQSGLWNINYVNESYDPKFLPIFEELISRYEKGDISTESLAPPNWRLNMLRGTIGQHELF